MKSLIRTNILSSQEDGEDNSLSQILMPIELSKEKKQEAITSLQRYFKANMEEEIGNITAGALLEFIIEEIGPAIYNKAVADAQERMQLRVSELDTEIFEDEFLYWRKLDRQKSGRK